MKKLLRKYHIEAMRFWLKAEIKTFNKSMSLCDVSKRMFDWHYDLLEKGI